MGRHTPRIERRRPRVEAGGEPDEDADGRALAKLLSASVAESTAGVYARKIGEWRKYARGDTSIECVARFLANRAEATASYNVVEAYRAAVGFEFAQAGLEPPGGHPFIVRVMKGAKRLYSKPTRKKKPFTTAHIKQMVVAAESSDKPSLKRAAWALALAHGHFLRISEVMGLTGADISLNDDDDICLTVRQAKNHLHGFDVRVRRGSGQPVKVHKYVRKLMAMSAVRVGDRSSFLMAKCGGGGKVAVSTVHADVKKLVKLVGLDPDKYSFHSARHGAATEAARAGCTVAELRFLGRWRGYETPAEYTQFDEEDRHRLDAKIRRSLSK